MPTVSRWRVGSTCLFLATATSLACGPKTPLSASPLQRWPVVSLSPVVVDAARLEALVHAEVNRVRSMAGLRVLAWNNGLVGIARGHSMDMGRRSYFAHNSPEGTTPDARYRQGGYACRVPVDKNTYLTSGENLYQSHRVAVFAVAANGNKSPHSYHTMSGLALRTVEGWLNSPEHRKNMLKGAWRSEAIGVYIHSDGTIYITQNFC